MKTSLQNRLITVLIIFSMVFIAIFTGIQIYNQLNRAVDFNYYRAKTGALLLQQNLNAALKDVAQQELRIQQNTIQGTINVLYSSNIISKATVFSRTGDVLFSTDSSIALSKKDAEVLKGIFQNPSVSSQIYSTVNKQNNTVSLYIPCAENIIAKIEYDLGNIRDALSEVYIPVAITVILVIIANIALAVFLSKILIQPIAILNNITGEIARGNLDKRIEIKSEDEMQELAETFNYMTEELIKMKRIAEDANPLTKLPGNIVIRNEIDKRIKSTEKFLVIYCDLDNFKAFNDKYGIEAGDKAIQLTADIFKEAMSRNGNKGDFIGHEGGDDFILLTTPEKGKDITDYIMAEFDKRIRLLYNKEDLERGYIEAHSRQGDIMKFPIMSISLSGVTNQIRTIVSYGEVTNIAAEVKKKAKSIEGSCFYVDRRKS